MSGGGRHTVRIDLPPGLPRVMADRQRLVQVLNNLLANAARHSPESAPIRIAAEHEGLHVAVSVSDEGRGIAPDHLGQLFRKYTVAGDQEGGIGSGLGLAICKGLIEAHGWAHPGRERRRWPRRALHLHDPGGRGVRRRSRPGPPRTAGPRTGRGAHPGGRRRPGDAAPSPRHVGGGGLRPAGHRRPPGAAAHYPGREAPTGPARPDAARDRRRRADADRSRARRPAGHLYLGLRARRDHRSGAGGRRRRLRGQAVLADRAHGAASGRPCAGGRTPPPSSSATSPSTTSGAGSAWPGAR